MIESPRHFQRSSLPALCTLLALASGCGSSSMSDAEANATDVSVLVATIGGGGAIGDACNPNFNPFDANSYQDPNYVSCAGGSVQYLSPAGEFFSYPGCYTSSQSTLDVLLAARCKTYGADARYTHPPQVWTAAKKVLLKTSPLNLHDVACSDAGVECVSDFMVPRMTFTVDGTTNTFSWPGNASGMNRDLETVLDQLRQLGFSL